MARTAAGRRRERAGDIKLSITPSGKVIWRDKYPTEYKGWSAGDHLYAAIIHEANRTQGGEIARAHRALAGESRAISPADVAEAHRTGASLAGRRSHASRSHATKKSKESSDVQNYGTTRFGVALGGLHYRVIIERDWERGGYAAKLVSEGIGTIMEPNGRTAGEALAALVRDLRAGDATDQKLAARIEQFYWGPKGKEGKRLHATKASKRRYQYRGVVVGEGLLIGGTKRHVSSWFDTKKEADDWAWAVSEGNETAKRPISTVTIERRAGHLPGIIETVKWAHAGEVEI